MTDGFNSCRNVVCNFTEGIDYRVFQTNMMLSSVSAISELLVVHKLLMIMWAVCRCHVFVPSNTIASKSNRGRQTIHEGSGCFLLSQAFGGHWHIHCTWFRIWTKRRVQTSPFISFIFPSFKFITFVHNFLWKDFNFIIHSCILKWKFNHVIWYNYMIIFAAIMFNENLCSNSVLT